MRCLTLLFIYKFSIGGLTQKEPLKEIHFKPHHQFQFILVFYPLGERQNVVFTTEFYYEFDEILTYSIFDRCRNKISISFDYLRIYLTLHLRSTKTNPKIIYRYLIAIRSVVFNRLEKGPVISDRTLLCDFKNYFLLWYITFRHKKIC